MLKKAYDLSKYIMTMLFMLLPTPIYMCLENESFQKIETTNWVTVAAISLYLLLTLFIVLVADNVKYWVISGMLTTLLLCVGCMIDPFFYKSLVVPSLPFAEGNLMTDELFGWELPPVLLTIIWGAEKIVFGALYMIVYKLVNKLKNRQYVLKLKKEFKIIVIASIISILLVAICFTYDYIVTGEVFSLKDVFSTILLPFAFLIYMVLIKYIAVLLSLQLNYIGWADVGALVLILVPVLLIGFFVWRKLEGKPKVISAVKIGGTVVLFCLYVFVFLSFNLL